MPHLQDFRIELAPCGLLPPQRDDPQGKGDQQEDDDRVADPEDRAGSVTRSRIIEGRFLR